MKKIVFVVCAFLFIGWAKAQDLQKNSFEISAFRNTGNGHNPVSSMLNYGISLNYNRYLFKRWNVGAGWGFGDFNGKGYNGLFEKFYEFKSNRNYTQYHVRLGFEPIQTKRFILGVQAEFLRFSYNGISEIIIGGPGQPGDDPRRVTLGRSRVSGGFFGPYGVFNFSESFFLRGNYLIGIPVLNYDWRCTNMSLGVGYRF
ncbi:hypothetical protein ACFSKL_20465 [Belliella marina]|uniref:Outer membrane protein beta-barrel domain-containing protein n=1 Tax=Belliella marina TaxID=1644146 RepID=A0ABW4VV17_9BACT